MIRIASAVFLVAVAALGAAWIGEDAMFPASVFGAMDPWLMLGIAAVALVTAAAATAALVWRRGVILRIAAAVAMTVAVIAGFRVGELEQTRALNECSARFDSLRAQLADFHGREGRYPSALAELGPVPCQRRLRGTLLSYSTTPEGYDLSFGDYLVTWHATEAFVSVTK